MKVKAEYWNTDGSSINKSLNVVNTVFVYLPQNTNEIRYQTMVYNLLNLVLSPSSDVGHCPCCFFLNVVFVMRKETWEDG